MPLYLAAKIIESAVVERAMRDVDRGDFAPGDKYEDSPQTLGFGATISAPHMVRWPSRSQGLSSLTFSSPYSTPTAWRRLKISASLAPCAWTLAAAAASLPC